MKCDEHEGHVEGGLHPNLESWEIEGTFSRSRKPRLFIVRYCFSTPFFIRKVIFMVKVEGVGNSANEASFDLGLGDF